MRRPHPGVRTRSTVAVTAAVAAVLAGSAVLLLLLLRRDLVAAADAAARQRAGDVTALLAERRLPAVIPSSSDETGVVQVLSPEGAVLASSANIAGESPLPAVRLRPGQSVVRTLHDLPVAEGDNERYRVLTLATVTPDGPRQVVVAVSLRQADAALASTGRTLATGLPAVLLVTAAVTSVGVGRALRPIERIRLGAAALSGAAPSGRVPVPQTNDEVHRLATTMNSLLARMQDASERQRRFTADASHELRSPLANLAAVLEVASAADDPQQWRDSASELRRELGRMSHLVDDLLLLSQVDSAAPQRTVEVDLDDLVHAEAQRLRQLGTVQVAVPPLPALRVAGDPHRLARAIRNLGDNAARHARERVTLSLRRDRRDAVVQIADDGAGVPEAERERVFERFTRLDDARARDTGGSGLGLAISREIAQAHHGQLRMLAGEAPGATFELRLPLAQG